MNILMFEKHHTSAKCYVQLAVTECPFGKVHPLSLECLPLTLVDCHCEGDADRELVPLELDRNLRVRRDQRDHRNEDLFELIGFAAVIENRVVPQDE